MNKEEHKYKLYGRFRGRKRNKASNSSLLNDFNADLKKDININNYNVLDIGSGSGENAIYLAKKYPKAQIITRELFEDGNINLCSEIVKNKIKNIKLFQGNVLKFLDMLNSELIFDEIWILFPDPWPKIRHHKRRLISASFLEIIYLYLKNNAKLIIASDSNSYKRTILNLISECRDDFFWENQSFNEWNYDMLNLPKTKFNKKALKSKRNSMIFKLNKI